MPNTYVLLTEQEFWDKLRSIVVEKKLIAFKLHQGTRELTVVDICKQLPELERMEDLWLSLKQPNLDSEVTPAQDGWILVRPPERKGQKTLRPGSLGVVTTYLDRKKSSMEKNVELDSLFKECRKRLLRNTKSGIAEIGDFLDHRNEPIRFSESIKSAIADGWTFFSPTCIDDRRIVKLSERKKGR